MEASDVVVNHGGNGTVYQAILSGTPIVGIPSHVDQELNLQRVEDLGIGVKLSPKNLSTCKLVSALKAVMEDPKYKQNARKLQALAKRYDGARTAAACIEEYMEEHLG